MENQKTTFPEFLEKYKIEIPIIQRDYAQGRNDENCGKVRETFLRSLYKCVKSEKPINLDFIYGSEEAVDNTNVFLPLDGQQRLTTLFLLYLYAAKKDGIKFDKEKNNFNKFTYETRISAREFCNSLAEQNFEIKKEDKTVSETVKDLPWFYSCWNNDPTIRAMLNMLDSIHKEFREVDDLYFKLTNGKLISFYQIQLNDFGLSDDLYIKMNARGETLTLFENLKAEIEKRAQDNKWEENAGEFSHKIDVDWTNFMWERYCREEDERTLPISNFDDSFMRLITSVVMSEKALKHTKDNSFEEAIRTLNNNFEDRSLIELIDKDIFVKIKKVFELYCNNKNDLSLEGIELWHHAPDRTLFDHIVCDSSKENNRSASYSTQVLFFAQTEYLLNNEFDPVKFKDWMRVVRNLILRCDMYIANRVDAARNDVLRYPDIYIAFIKLVEKLSKGSSDIYKFLSEEDFKSNSRTKDVENEKIKASIITKYNKQDLINRLENIDILKGDISFALDCAGYKDKIEDIDFGILEKTAQVLEKYFKGKEKDILTNDLRRAFLATEVEGKYYAYCYWEGTCSAFGNRPHKRRRILHSFNELEFIILRKNDFPAYKHLKKLVSLLENKDYKGIINSLEKRPQEMPEWQFELIKNNKWLDEACMYFFAIEEENGKEICSLLENSNPQDISKTKKVKRLSQKIPLADSIFFENNFV